ncbi:MAG: hypothetical protein ACKVWR_05025 [Acidimicrobiales bacterium]
MATRGTRRPPAPRATDQLGPLAVIVVVVAAFLAVAFVLLHPEDFAERLITLLLGVSIAVVTVTVSQSARRRSIDDAAAAGYAAGAAQDAWYNHSADPASAGPAAAHPDSGYSVSGARTASDAERGDPDGRERRPERVEPDAARLRSRSTAA